MVMVTFLPDHGSIVKLGNFRGLKFLSCPLGLQKQACLSSDGAGKGNLTMLASRLLALPGRQMGHWLHDAGFVIMITGSWALGHLCNGLCEGRCFAD